MLDNMPIGFGQRLKSERKRIRLNQHDFGDKVGIKRVTQYQYEAEVNSPNVRYLASIHALGVDLFYILFGQRINTFFNQTPEIKMIEQKAFILLSQNEDFICGKLSSEDQYVIFDILRSHLIEHSKT